MNAVIEMSQQQKALSINVRQVSEKVSNAYDKYVAGVYAVAFSVDVQGLSDTKRASMMLDVFHSRQSIGCLDDFEIDVIDETGCVIEQDPDHEDYSASDAGDVEKVSDTPRQINKAGKQESKPAPDEDDLEALADAEFLDYDFGPRAQVIDHYRFDVRKPGCYSKRVYLDHADDAEDESREARFYVQFSPDGSVAEVFAIEIETGERIGRRAEPNSVYPPAWSREAPTELVDWLDDKGYSFSQAEEREVRGEWNWRQGNTSSQGFKSFQACVEDLVTSKGLLDEFVLAHPSFADAVLPAVRASVTVKDDRVIVILDGGAVQDVITSNEAICCLVVDRDDPQGGEFVQVAGESAALDAMAQALPRVDSGRVNAMFAEIGRALHSAHLGNSEQAKAILASLRSGQSEGGDADGVVLSPGQDLNTVLAALRFYQGAGMGNPDYRSDEIHDIATNGGADISLDDAGIDDLCERLNMGRA